LISLETVRTRSGHTGKPGTAFVDRREAGGAEGRHLLYAGQDRVGVDARILCVVVVDCGRGIGLQLAAAGDPRPAKDLFGAAVRGEEWRKNGGIEAITKKSPQNFCRKA
jgi:hypothetical protein